MTRRFDLGPLLTVVGAAVLLIALFLDWYGRANAWQAFEVADVLLAALAVGSLVAAVGVVAPEVPTLERRWLGWLVGATLVLVAAELINPPPLARDLSLGLGAWLGLASACVMAVGAVLTLASVSLAVAVEGRDVRQRVAAVDHRPPPTEAHAPVPGTQRRVSEPLLGRREEEAEAGPPAEG